MCSHSRLAQDKSNVRVGTCRKCGYAATTDKAVATTMGKAAIVR